MVNTEIKCILLLRTFGNSHSYPIPWYHPPRWLALTGRTGRVGSWQTWRAAAGQSSGSNSSCYHPQEMAGWWNQGSPLPWHSSLWREGTVSYNILPAPDCLAPGAVGQDVPTVPGHSPPLRGACAEARGITIKDWIHRKRILSWASLTFPTAILSGLKQQFCSASFRIRIFFVVGNTCGCQTSCLCN